MFERGGFAPGPAPFIGARRNRPTRVSALVTRENINKVLIEPGHFTKEDIYSE